MTPEELKQLREEIVKETETRMMSADFVDRLRLSLERDSAIKTVNAQGQFADPALRVIQHGSLSPIDHQEATVAPFKTDSSKMYRVINRDNDELFRLRRHQGYEPVRDDSGDEVRYMDGVLAAMPKRQYDETIGAEKRARKMLRKQSSKTAAQNYIEMGKQSGLEVTGSGVKVDVDR